jgi:hypothetical protein
MKTVEEIRRQRLSALREEFGSYARLASMLDMTARDSTLSQIGNQSKISNSDKRKQMGSELARRLELVTHKPVGWMDSDPDAWPFDKIDLAKVQQLKPADLGLIQGMVLVLATQAGLDLANGTTG